MMVNPLEAVIVGPCTLYFGNCLKLFPVCGPPILPVQALISDPPYGANEKTDRSTRLSSVRLPGEGQNIRRIRWQPVLGDDQPFDPLPWLGYKHTVLWGANYYADKLPSSRCWLVWDKREGTTPDDNADVELAWCSADSVARIYSQLWRGMCVRGEENAQQKLHPTQKPVALMAWCLERAKVPVDATVLDPYMGSGTTGIACIRTGRKFIGVEQDPTHFETACDRIARELDGKLL